MIMALVRGREFIVNHIHLDMRFHIQNPGPAQEKRNRVQVKGRVIRPGRRTSQEIPHENVEADDKNKDKDKIGPDRRTKFAQFVNPSL